MAIGPSGHVQAQQRPLPLPEVPPVVPPRPPQPAEKLASINIQQGQMSEAIAQLNAALKAAGIPEPNVIYSPGADTVPVPSLTLRNIRAADALQLIAASAGRSVEPLAGTDHETIGFRIGGPAGGPMSSTFDPSLAPGFGGGMPGLDAGHGHAAVAPPPIQATPPNFGAPSTNPPLGAMPGAPAGGGMIVSLGSAPEAPSVRIYPLGVITTVTKFTDIETTLRDVLKASGIAPDDAKLALHEKTNVLVVTGNSRAHDVVKQLLDSLEKNQSAATAANTQELKSRSEAIELQVRLEAERQQRERLTKQLEQSEMQLREMMNELERVKAAKPR